MAKSATKVHAYRVMIEHTRGTTILRTVVIGCDIARIVMQGTGQDSIDTGLELLREATDKAIAAAFTLPWIPSTGLVGPRPYRTPEAALAEEMQARLQPDK